MSRALLVYWCPICKVQTERSRHSLHDGRLYPPTVTEHDCETIEVIPGRDYDELSDEAEALLRRWLEYTGLRHRVLAALDSDDPSEYEDGRRLVRATDSFFATREAAKSQQRSGR